MSPDHHRPTAAWAFVASLALHLAVLFYPQREPLPQPRPPRIEATLDRRKPVRPEVQAKVQPPSPSPKAERRPRERQLLTAPRSRESASSRQWTTAERDDMNRFLDGLAAEAKATPKPTLAQRARTMARDLGRQQAAQEAEAGATLERIPDTPPPDQFSLEYYVEGLIKRLNKSAAYVRNDPRAKGVRTASIQFRVNPDGSLRSFVVLNAGDQQMEIDFIRAVVERSAPFAAFPRDLAGSARSLAMTICILPSGSGGFGFSRMPEGRGC